MGAGDTRVLTADLSSLSRVIKKTADDMLQGGPSDAFPDRHREHIAYALRMVASSGFLSPPAAIGAFYLATRFEFYFRVLSNRLKADGKWKTDEDQREVQNLLADKRLKNHRINSVALAYKIMKTNEELSLSEVCDCLDKTLFSSRTVIPDQTVVSDIGDRIEYVRHRSAHGHWGDISAEANFYGLMTAIVFYNQH